jgi:hypothetical protein
MVTYSNIRVVAYDANLSKKKILYLQNCSTHQLIQSGHVAYDVSVLGTIWIPHFRMKFYWIRSSTKENNPSETMKLWVSILRQNSGWKGSDKQVIDIYITVMFRTFTNTDLGACDVNYSCRYLYLTLYSTHILRFNIVINIGGNAILNRWKGMLCTQQYKIKKGGK